MCSGAPMSACNSASKMSGSTAFYSNGDGENNSVTPRQLPAGFRQFRESNE